MNKIVFSFFLLVFSVELNAQLVINEIKNQCEDNLGCIIAGNWIELYNSSEDTLEIGLFFTDNKQDLKQWPVLSDHGGKNVVDPNQYLIIGINESSAYSSLQVTLPDKRIDTLYLVSLKNGKYQVIDVVVCDDDVFAVNQTSSTGKIGAVWVSSLEPTPLHENKEGVLSTPKRRMEITVVPFGISNVSLTGNPGQENKPIYSFGVGFRRTRRMFKVFDFQYGLSVYRIGYNATYSTTDALNGKERERKSTLKSRGVRAGIDVKLGVPITPRFTFYSGFELGFVNYESITTQTDLIITFPDGSTTSNSFNSKSNEVTTMTYLLGVVFEAEYYWKNNLSFSVKYVSRKEPKQDTDVQAKQWNVMAGVNWRFWSSRKTAPKWSLLK